MLKLIKKPVRRNYVAKNSVHKTGAGIHRDRTKYTRKVKHK